MALPKPKQEKTNSLLKAVGIGLKQSVKDTGTAALNNITQHLSDYTPKNLANRAIDNFGLGNLKRNIQNALENDDDEDDNQTSRGKNSNSSNNSSNNSNYKRYDPTPYKMMVASVDKLNANVMRLDDSIHDTNAVTNSILDNIYYSQLDTIKQIASLAALMSMKKEEKHYTINPKAENDNSKFRQMDTTKPIPANENTHEINNISNNNLKEKTSDKLVETLKQTEQTNIENNTKQNNLRTIINDIMPMGINQNIRNEPAIQSILSPTSSILAPSVFSDPASNLEHLIKESELNNQGPKTDFDDAQHGIPNLIDKSSFANEEPTIPGENIIGSALGGLGHLAELGIGGSIAEKVLGSALPFGKAATGASRFLSLGGKLAKGAATGIGGLALTLGGDAAIDHFVPDGARGKETAKSALEYGSLGATIGSVIPGVGTLIGGGVGALAGAGIANYDDIKNSIFGTPETNRSASLAERSVENNNMNQQPTNVTIVQSPTNNTTVSRGSDDNGEIGQLNAHVYATPADRATLTGG